MVQMRTHANEDIHIHTHFFVQTDEEVHCEVADEAEVPVLVAEGPRATRPSEGLGAWIHN